MRFISGSIRPGVISTIFLFFLLTGTARGGLDAPHNETAPAAIGCLTCHHMTSTYPKLLPPSGSTPQNLDDTLANNLCWSCHNDVAAPYVTTHSSLQSDNGYGDWTVECWVCHNQHTQEQDNYNGSTYGKFIRRSISLDHISGLAKTGVKAVRFLGATGPGSFADGDATVNGICEVCHTQTSNWRNDGSFSGAAEHTGLKGSNCIQCHPHDQGFKADYQCLDCHKNPANPNNRAAIAQQFGGNSHHVQRSDGAITNTDCYQCHWEADAEGKVTGYHDAVPNALVDLVIYGAGTRPDTYVAGTTAVPYAADGSRTQIVSLNAHCVGCHDDDSKGVDIFGDARSPDAYSWDGTSVDARYSQSGSVFWGKYATVPSKYDRIKAYSAHGNAGVNQRGWNNVELWTTMASVTNSGVGPGAGMAYDGGDFIYLTAGNDSTKFLRYSIRGNSWTLLAATPSNISGGGDLVYDGSDSLYLTKGSATATFYRYSISGNSWTEMTAAPASISYGGALVYAGGDTIYATRGRLFSTFYRYSISSDSWTEAEPAPAAINYGGNLVYDGADSIYATQGGGTTFYRYSISGNSWSSLAPAPDIIASAGAALAHDGGDFIYATRGNYTTNFYRYSISGDSWTEMNETPVYIRAGSELAAVGSRTVFVLQGVSSGFYRFNADTSGTESIGCFDCHNSHGSAAAGTTVSYASATVNGGIFKDTESGFGGYSMTYKPAAGGSAAAKNGFNTGAGLCFDCHLTATSGVKPWGYQNTFGAIKKITGYWDTEYFGSGTFGSQQNYPYKSGTGHQGGHFGASSALANTPAGAINGLCTPCHDPHGVSTTLGSNQQFAVPLLKGTWMTSPYQEDSAPAKDEVGTANPKNKYDSYKLGLNYHRTPEVTQPATQFAGLCLTCHLKDHLTDGANGGAWESVDRIHESVSGWGAGNHKYSCSKCHTPHNSRLPRLMVTNCLDNKHKGLVADNPSPVINGSGWGGVGSGGTPIELFCDETGECSTETGYNGSAEGSGWGNYPGLWQSNHGVGTSSLTPSIISGCHADETGAWDNQRWNVKTRW